MSEFGSKENIVNFMKGLRKFDGKPPGTFREWGEGPPSF